jgi:predicted nucleic acid-binding protein
MTIVLDSSVLIAVFNSRDAHHAAAVRILDEASAEDLVLSSISLAEVLVGPARSGDEESALRALARLDIAEESLPGDGAVQLARLRAGTGLKMPDCCVLLAAQTANAHAIATFDSRLARAARERGVHALGS